MLPEQGRKPHCATRQADTSPVDAPLRNGRKGAARKARDLSRDHLFDHADPSSEYFSCNTTGATCTFDRLRIQRLISSTNTENAIAV